MNGSVARRQTRSRAATTIAFGVAGLSTGALAGWAFAEARIHGGYVENETGFFVSAVLGLAAAGGLLLTGLGSLVKRPLVSGKAVLYSAALEVAVVGLLFALFLNQPCTKFIATTGSSIAFTCVESDHRLGLRLFIGIGAAAVALTLAVFARRRAD